MIAGPVLLAVSLCGGALPASEVIPVATARGGVPVDAAAPLWRTVAGREVWVAPQRSVPLNDRAANGALRESSPFAVTVKAVSDSKRLGVLLEWTDPAESRPARAEVGAFGDAAAIQLPAGVGGGSRLPYVGMGDEDAHVLLMMVRAIEGGEVEVKELVAAGPGSHARAEAPRFAASMSYDSTERRWRAVFVRPLVAGGHSLARAIVPIAVAVWDGAKNERGGNKSLSAWKYLELPKQPADPAWVSALEREYALGGPLDAGKGKELFGSMCTSCHRIGDQGTAARGMAPDLAAIGAISTPAYLARSIVSPNEVIVPHPGARPADPQMAWYIRDEDGKMMSKMPSFELPAEELWALVGYLATLGRRSAE